MAKRGLFQTFFPARAKQEEEEEKERRQKLMLALLKQGLDITPAEFEQAVETGDIPTERVRGTGKFEEVETGGIERLPVEGPLPKTGFGFLQEQRGGLTAPFPIKERREIQETQPIQFKPRRTDKEGQQTYIWNPETRKYEPQEGLIVTDPRVLRGSPTASRPPAGRESDQAKFSRSADLQTKRNFETAIRKRASDGIPIEEEEIERYNEMASRRKLPIYQPKTQEEDKGFFEKAKIRWDMFFGKDGKKSITEKDTKTRKLNPNTGKWWVFRDGQWQEE